MLIFSSVCFMLTAAVTLRMDADFRGMNLPKFTCYTHCASINRPFLSSVELITRNNYIALYFDFWVLYDMLVFRK